MPTGINTDMKDKAYVVINMRKLGVEIFTIRGEVAKYLGIHRNTVKLKDGMFFYNEYCVIESSISTATKLGRHKNG